MGLRRFIRKHFGSKNSLGSAVKIIKSIENDELKSEFFPVAWKYAALFTYALIILPFDPFIADKRLNGTLASTAAIATPIKGVATKSGATNKLQQSAKTKSTASIKSPAIVGVSEGKCQQKSKTFRIS